MTGLGSDLSFFLAMVFIAVVLLLSSVIVPTVGSEAQATKRIRKRIDGVLGATQKHFVTTGETTGICTGHA